MDFAFPLKVRQAGLEGADIIREVAPNVVPYLLAALRMIYFQCLSPQDVKQLRRNLRALRTRVAGADLPPTLKDPLTILVDELRGGCAPDVLSVASSSLADWADSVSASGTALLFKEAAALVAPEYPRLAWVAGRAFRDGGKLVEGELWLRRAIRIAVWVEDAETQDLALNSLGNLFAQRGSFRVAISYLERALRVARNISHERTGAVTHDFFVVFLQTGQLERAEEAAACAWELYGPGHPRLPLLANDIAHLWMRQGRFTAAYQLLQGLANGPRTEEERLFITSSLARAAGGCGDRVNFEIAWQSIAELVGHDRDAPSWPWLQAAKGAASLGDWERAEGALSLAIEAARCRRAYDDLAEAEAALDMVRRYQRIDHRLRSIDRQTARFADALVETLAESDSLQSTGGPPGRGVL